MHELLKADGRYIYCVADTGVGVTLDKTGLDGAQVYTIPYWDICAVVHDCAAEPYSADDQERVKKWVLAHQTVVDAAWEKWGSVLPSALSTIIKGEPGEDAGDSVRLWLEKDYHKLRQNLAKIRERAEYGVQVFWDPKVIAENIAQASPEIRELERQTRGTAKGIAYMHRQRLENLLRREVEDAADRFFKECYWRIKKHVDDIRVEQVKKLQPRVQMILNVSCLVARTEYPKLGEELDEINRMDGLSVRFTGPWPPYSFVG